MPVPPERGVPQKDGQSDAKYTDTLRHFDSLRKITQKTPDGDTHLLFGESPVAGVEHMDSMEQAADQLMLESSQDDRTEEYLAAFDIFDQDKSGSISIEELQDIIQKLDLNISDAQLRKIVEEADENHDGEIDREEFLTLMREQDKQLLNSEYRETFDKFDLDKNGLIEFEELLKVMKVIDTEITDQEVQEMFADADADGDGSISFDEFVFMMESSLS